MRVTGFTTLLMIALLSGCTVGYVPLKENNVRVQDDIAILETPEYSLIVQPSFWTHKPDNLTEYYTTFKIRVRNKTSHKISVDSDDIILLDENRHQYDPVSSDYIIRFLVDESPTLRNFSNTPVNMRQEQEWYQDQLEARQKLMSESYHFGEIHPGATKDGYVFFQKIPPRNYNLEFIFKDQRIRFTRERDKK